MPINDFVFSVKGIVLDERISRVSFRVSTTGEKKIIDCQAIRVKEIKPSTIREYEVAAITLRKKVVKDYHDLLRKRGV
jgi:hypothetical protein